MDQKCRNTNIHIISWILKLAARFINVDIYLKLFFKVACIK